jgi:hypothetical protein
MGKKYFPQTLREYSQTFVQRLSPGLCGRFGEVVVIHRLIYGMKFEIGTPKWWWLLAEV